MVWTRVNEKVEKGVESSNVIADNITRYTNFYFKKITGDIAYRKSNPTSKQKYRNDRKR